MSWDTRIGIAGLIMAFAGVGFTILWPSKRRLGWFCLSTAMLLGLCWTWIEFGAAVWGWLKGPHGPGFYMLVGGAAAIFALAFIATLIRAAIRLREGENPPKGFLDYRNDAEIAMLALPSLT